MTNLEPCDLHEMIGCQVCHPRPRPTPQWISQPFEARFASPCAHCTTGIEPGDLICMADGEAIHDHCR